MMARAAYIPYLSKTMIVIFLLGVQYIWSDAQPSALQSPDNKKSVLFADPEDINLIIPIKDLKTNKTTKESFILKEDSLKDLQLTLQQVKQGWIEVLFNGERELVVQGKRILLSVKPKIYQFIDHKTGKVAFIVNMERFENQKMKDIEDDKTLIPLPRKKIDWESPPRCFLRSISLSVTGSSIDCEINGIQTMKHEVRIEKSSPDKFIGEGLLLSVLNPNTCKTTLEVVAPTSDVTGHRDLLWALDSISPGKIVLVASLRDGSAYLGEKSRVTFTKMGSLWAPSYLYRDSWLNLFVKGGKTIQDILIPNLGSVNSSGSPFTVHIDDQQLSPKQPYACLSWPSTQRWKARRVFCDTHDGFPGLCDCERPLEFKAKNNSEKVIIPILVMAGNRTRHLYRLLSSLAFQENVTKETIMLVSDGYLEDVTHLAFILDLMLLVHQPEGNGVVKISRNLRFTLYHGFQTFPEAETFIILEDDLILSPDFYSFMIQMEPIFKMDKTVFCVSAFNHLSYPHTSGDPTLTYRVQAYPAYGWMMPRTILEEIVPKWLPAHVVFEWDYFFGSQFVMKGRECIIPDINRSYHWSTKGVHSSMSRYYTEIFYLSRNINQDPNVILQPLERLRQGSYEDEFKKLMAKSIPVVFIERSNLDNMISQGQVYAVYVYQKEKNDDVSFRAFAQVLEIWSYDFRDHHNFAWRFLYKNATVIVVGVPWSPYRVYKPHRHPVFKATKENNLAILQEENFEKSWRRIATHKQSFLLPGF